MHDMDCVPKSTFWVFVAAHTAAGFLLGMTVTMCGHVPPPRSTEYESIEPPVVEHLDMYRIERAGRTCIVDMRGDGAIVCEDTNPVAQEE